MRATDLPDVVDGRTGGAERHTGALPNDIAGAGQKGMSKTSVTGQRVGLGVLLVGIAVATVVIPPLITPDRKPAAAPPASSLAPPAALVPAVTVSARPSRSPSSGPQGCVPAKPGTVEVSSRPSCAVYTASLGNGWTITGDGMKVLPAAVVPDTKETAIRVERTRPAIPATSVALACKSPIGISPGGRLTLRIWGGREYGTVVKLAVAPAHTGSVLLAAPADRWTTFTVKLSELTRGTTLARIDLAVAADQMPNVNRFFLDDITILG